jgi:small subunit ribosomal protein S18
MNNLENEQELKVEKTENNLDQEEKIKETSAEAEHKPNKKVSFKPHKPKRLPVKVVKKNNYFVRNSITYIDYKDTKLLSHFVNKQGQIISKIFSKLPSNIQRMMAKSIKRARQIKLMPYIVVDQGNF